MDKTTYLLTQLHEAVEGRRSARIDLIQAVQRVAKRIVKEGRTGDLVMVGERTYLILNGAWKACGDDGTWSLSKGRIKTLCVRSALSGPWVSMLPLSEAGATKAVYPKGEKLNLEDCSVGDFFVRVSKDSLGEAGLPKDSLGEEQLKTATEDDYHNFAQDAEQTIRGFIEIYDMRSKAFRATANRIEEMEEQIKDDPKVEKAIIQYEEHTLDPLTTPEYAKVCRQQAQWLRELLHLRSVMAYLQDLPAEGSQRPLKEYLKDVEARRNTKEE